MINNDSRSATKHLYYLSTTISAMANPSFNISDELLEEFDDTIWELKKEGKIDRNASRSEVLQNMIRSWIKENRQEMEAAD